MQCPYHDEPLKKEIYEAEIEIDMCPTCRGLWLDPGELETIQQTQEIDYSERLEHNVNKEAMEYNRERQLKAEPIKCPGCSTLMEKQEHDHNSLIVIDFCPSCFGIWLDEGELEALEIYYEREHLKHPDMTRMQLLLAGFYRLYHRA
ncbi:zf-TFIIB domain-containing protein [Myxococcota bacterium]|nr:zf-TFIIB domain-containing protein [Myxococcota bacterium]